MRKERGRAGRSFATALAVAAALVALAGTARADVVYNETFDDVSSDLLTDYGFTLSGWSAGGSYTAAGGEAVMSGMGSVAGKLTHALTTPYAYDWSNEMTLSANLSSTATDYNKHYGIWLGNLGFARNVGDFTTNGRGGTFSGDGNQITGWLDTENAIDDDAGFSIAITVRQNATPANFDVLFQVNGVNQGIGWYTGLSKNTYGLDGNISTLGVYGDGTATGGVFTLDNLQLSVIPEPGTLGLLGATAIAMLLRRKIRG